MEDTEGYTMSSFDDIVTSFKETIKDASDAQLEEISAEVIATVPKEINPNTADAYIYGCLTSQWSSASVCVPSCLNGFKPSNMRACDMAVYEKKNGKVKKSNKVKTPNAYLYMDEDENEEVGREQLRTFSRHGITELFVYKRKPNSLEYEHIETKEIKRKNPKRRQASWGAGAAVALVILFFFIIFLVLLWRYMKSD